VLLAPDGTSGIQRAVTDQPDLILLDIMMPDMDGFEVCRYLKTHENTRNIPVIFMTAMSETGDKVKGFNSGAEDYITKPFQSEEVLARVNAHLSIQRLYKDLDVKYQELLGKYGIVSKNMSDLRLNLSSYLPHEFRTPLTAILGLSELLLSFDSKQSPTPDEILKMQTFIYNNALRLQRLTENYLLYAKLRLMEIDPQKREQQEMEQSDDILSIKSFITSIAMTKAQKAQRQDDLRLVLADAKIWISAKSLQKIVEELLDNALKFSKPDTPVDVITTVNTHQWTLKITDRGCGMTAEQVANIGAFMQFERRQYEQQGLGLGLEITRLLVQSNDGKLGVESAPNQGTTVTVTFNRKT
jgi:signal transduction histidine kinase